MTAFILKLLGFTQKSIREGWYGPGGSGVSRVRQVWVWTAWGLKSH